MQPLRTGGGQANYVVGSATTVPGIQVLLITPGWVSAPMTGHVLQRFFNATTERAGRIVDHAMISPRAVVYFLVIGAGSWESYPTRRSIESSMIQLRLLSFH